MATVVLALYVILATWSFDHRFRAPRTGMAYPRIQQAAGIIDLLSQIDSKYRPSILRSLDGLDLQARVDRKPPDETINLVRAPRVEARLREFAAPGLTGELQAYTNAAVAQRQSDTEGFPARIVWSMPDGNVLVLTFVEHTRLIARFWRVPGFLAGVAGVVVAILALFLTRREGRLLQRVAASAEAFDGAPPQSIISQGEPPDMRRLALAVEEMQRRVVTLLQERSFLIAAISHDLKTYLTRVRLRAESFPDPEGRERMAGDLEAMTELIDTSLAFARGTTVAQHKNLVDLADLIAIEVAERAALDQKVAAVGGDQADAVVLGDPIALRRVFANLVDNALKFGGRRAEIRLETKENTYQISVSDDGRGIAEAERTAIFSPFYRIEGSRNRRTGGSGLGLAIARQIIEAHGGTIVVGVGPLCGACFVITLPKSNHA
jgi:two-component system, OmpR family, osmolarity sensor histidine kinase EnvZ